MKFDYFEDALSNPEKYELQLEKIPSEDWYGNPTYHHVAYINSENIGYERVDNPEDIENLICVFEKHNPTGITDNRYSY